MKRVIEVAPISGKWEVYPGLYVFTLVAPQIAWFGQPGQFVEIDAGAGFLLRRPFSIQDAREEEIEILVKVVGRGTENLVNRTEPWNILGPLGNPFSLPKAVNPVLIAGGVGVAPLKFLHSYLKKNNIESSLLIGAGDKKEIPLRLADPMRYEAYISTEDGSAGVKGTVIDLFLRNLDLWKKPYIYACGPLPMLKALRELMLTRGIKGEFSLESRMGCGMGVCQGCAIQVKDGYKLACKNGPVFPFQEIGEKFYQ